MRYDSSNPPKADADTSAHLVDSTIVFWEPEVDVGEPVPYQLLLTSHAHVSLSSIPFTSLAIHFNTDIPPIIVRHSEDDPDANIPAVQRIHMGDLVMSPVPIEPKEVEGALRWGAGTTIVFAGSVLSNLPTHISVSVYIPPNDFASILTMGRMYRSRSWS